MPISSHDLQYQKSASSIEVQSCLLPHVSLCQVEAIFSPDVYCNQGSVIQVFAATVRQAGSFIHCACLSPPLSCISCRDILGQHGYHDVPEIPRPLGEHKYKLSASRESQRAHLSGAVLNLPDPPEVAICFRSHIGFELDRLRSFQQDKHIVLNTSYL